MDGDGKKKVFKGVSIAIVVIGAIVGIVFGASTRISDEE